MSTPKPKPFYLLPEGDPVIASYKKSFEEVIGTETHTVTIDVPPEVVDGGYVEMPQEFILALQHYPQYIEQLLFCIELKFAQVADSELYFQPMDWKSDPKYYRWFNKMAQFPLTLFFINDADARFYMLAGDMLADGKFPVLKHDEQRGKNKISIEGENARLINARLWDACFLMLVYCYGSGFDPKTTIESVMADYNAGFTYDALHNSFMDEVKKGATFSAKPQTR